MITSIVDKEKQDSLTPDGVLKDLMQGNGVLWMYNA